MKPYDAFAFVLTFLAVFVPIALWYTGALEGVL